jgi:N-acyl-D-amino-acid deacylase
MDFPIERSAQDQSLAALAEARGCSPQEVAYDRLMETGGKGLFLSALGNYENGTLDSAREMLMHPDCIPALGDGGAHYGAICDASYSTFILTHWVRDAGDSAIGLPQAIHMLTAKAARAVGLNDRGLLQVGMKADINVIDLERMRLPIPHIAHDLPAGGRRLDQAAQGYDATIVSGKVIRRMDQGTGVFPGRLVRRAR